MFIKGVAFAAEELSTIQLRILKKGDVVALGVNPDKEPTDTIVIHVHVTAIDQRELLTRIEGYTWHNKKRANVIALLFSTPDSQGDGYAELTFYS